MRSKGACQQFNAIEHRSPGEHTSGGNSGGGGGGSSDENLLRLLTGRGGGPGRARGPVRLGKEDKVSVFSSLPSPSLALFSFFCSSLDSSRTCRTGDICEDVMGIYIRSRQSRLRRADSHAIT